jgi:hypothetical protein
LLTPDENGRQPANANANANANALSHPFISRWGGLRSASNVAMTQDVLYADFSALNNVFLTHRPGLNTCRLAAAR